jgi:ubiquinone/menaquinone biosynthesis C-methylase UbiE
MSRDTGAEERRQLEVEQFWNGRPCDSDTSTEERYSPEYFRDIEDERYRLQSHIHDFLSSLNLNGKRVLEIGTGVGTDARTIIRLGGDYTGINVDAGSSEMTHRALETFGLPGTVRQASALEIPFPDEKFDVVYSFGVLHHIPEVDRAIREIRRVLKPGGELAIMLYNRKSLNYALEIKHLRKWGLTVLGLPGVVNLLAKLGLPEEKLKRHLELKSTMGQMTEDEWLSRNTDGPDNPYSLVYDEQQTAQLLSTFCDVRQRVDFFDYRHWGLIGALIPLTLRREIASRWGWHRLVTAGKPPA